MAWTRATSSAGAKVSQVIVGSALNPHPILNGIAGGDIRIVLVVVGA
jgi:hypothetical protein